MACSYEVEDICKNGGKDQTVVLIEGISEAIWSRGGVGLFGVEG